MSKTSAAAKTRLSAAGWVSLLIVLLVAFGLRIFKLDAQSIWWDEGISLHLATSSLTEIVADRLNNIHPPLYFFILKIWVGLTGVNAFSARYLSALASWLQAALLWALLRRWFGLQTAGAALPLITLSAVSVIYGQEIRVYAFLPLIYLALLAITQAIINASGNASMRRQGGAAKWRLYIGLGIVIWLGLHLHYIAVFAVAYVTLWLWLIFYREQRWTDLCRWLLMAFLVSLASLPWFAALVWNWTAVQAEANAGTFITEKTPFWFLLAQVWVFQLTGLAGALGVVSVRWLASVTAVLLILLVILRLWQPASRRATIKLLAHWLLPLAAALVVWSVRSFSHPRYLVMYAIGLLLLAAFLIWPQIQDSRISSSRVAIILSALLAAGLLLTSVWGLWQYFFNPEIGKDDVRAVANILEETAVSGDLILVPDTDWSLPFEYDGPAAIAMPGLDQPDGAWQQLNQLTQDLAPGGRVFVLDYRRGARDWQQLTPFALESAGALISVIPVGDLEIQTYLLDTAVQPPQFESTPAAFGPLQLEQSWVEQEAAANSAVGAALAWRLAEPVEQRLQVALRLRNADGWLVAGADRILLDANGRPSDQWIPGEAVTTYHLLPLPQGLAPGNYQLSLTVFAEEPDGVKNLDLLDTQGAPQGQEFNLGSVQLNAALPAADGLRAPITPMFDMAVPFPTGLHLAGGLVENSQRLAGQSVGVQLLWQAPQAALGSQAITLSLWQDEKILVEESFDLGNGRYPINQWRPGEMVAHQYQIPTMADMSGAVTVVLSLGEVTYPLGVVDIKETDRLFELPKDAVPISEDVTFGSIVRLAGYKLPGSTFTTDEPVLLTLYWEVVGTSDKDYVVFTHVLNGNSLLIGQHDSQPAQSARPTSTWISGEYVIDEHLIELRQQGTSDSPILEIGLYEAQTGDRLLLPNGSDFYILPVTFEISSTGE